VRLGNLGNKMRGKKKCLEKIKKEVCKNHRSTSMSIKALEGLYIPLKEKKNDLEKGLKK